MLRFLTLVATFNWLACSAPNESTSGQNDVIGAEQNKPVFEYLKKVPIAAVLEALYTKLGMKTERTCFWLVRKTERNGFSALVIEVWRCGGDDKFITSLKLSGTGGKFRNLSASTDVSLVVGYLNVDYIPYEEDFSPGRVQEVGNLCLGDYANGCDITLDKDGVIEKLQIKGEKSANHVAEDSHGNPSY